MILSHLIRSSVVGLRMSIMNKTLILFLFLESLAFIASIINYKRDKSKSSFYLTVFLGTTFFIELVGFYTVLLDAYNFFSFVRGTVWESNYWLYNIQLIIAAIFYTLYFKWQLSSTVLHGFLNLLLGAFILGAVAFLIFSGVYFVAFSPFTLIGGTLMILLSISFYYLELLQSNLILNVTRSLPFYISIGALIFHLCTPPLFLYSMYFSESISPEFVSTYKLIIFGSNFIMYSVYIIGFILCSRSKRI